MSWNKGMLGVLIAGLVVVQPVSAQERGVALTVRGGGFNGLSSLNDAGTADFKRIGYNVGGGVGVDLHRHVGLRGDFTFARNELEQGGATTGTELSRFFYDVALQLQLPGASGWMPYAFVGAGGVTLHPVGVSNGDRTKVAGTGGVGVSYTIPGSNVGLVVEGKGWVYELSELGGGLSTYDRTQADVTWSAGLTYRIPFRSVGARASR